MAKIELPKTYEAATVEDQIYQKWEASGFFDPDKLPGDRPEVFVISMPPPNVTGILHLGHAFENSLMDIEIRYQRMKGKRALIVPGTDHAAVATQARVEDELKKQGITNPRQELGREELLKRIREFAENHKSIIIGQIKKMGTSCDWSRLAYTFDDKRSAAVNKLFKMMFDDGLIYRGYRVVNWSVKGQSTCSDDELVYETKKTRVYTFRYSKDFPITIATTRPETKLGDTAVAVHPDDGKYQKFIGQKFTVDVGAERPLTITVIGDKNVDMNYGTGAVGVTPAHSQIDFEMYQNNKDIGITPVIGRDGRMLKAAGPGYEGLTVLEARDKFVNWLKDNGLYVGEEEIEHNVGTSDRFKDVVEALPMDQWFVDVNKKITGRDQSLKDLMREAVTTGHSGDQDKIIKITPNRFQSIYLHWIDNLRDWCISRQIWWGHRLPVWYCDDCQEIFFSEGSPLKCPKCQSKNIRQDEDTLDTWFSSGAWTFSTLGWPDQTADLKKFHPTSWMQMGYEILFFWMARMILLSAYALDDIPFKEVYIHGMLRDKNGKKFSKSAGNGLDPLEIIEKYGTDALRLSLLKGTTPGNDMRFFEEKVAGARNFINKLWNISRFILQSVDDIKIITAKPTAQTLSDHWILQELEATTHLIEHLMDKYEFSLAAEKLQEFTWDCFADWYLEIAKIEGDKDEILLYVLQNILRLWHPFCPFITEELWHNFDSGLLMVETWPAVKAGPAKNKDFELIKQIITSIRNLRSENKIEPAKLLKAVIISGQKELLESQAVIIKRLARLESLTVTDNISQKPASSLGAVTNQAQIYLDLSVTINRVAEQERLNKEIGELEKYIKNLEVKLAGQEFISHAPKIVVDGEKEKLAMAQEKVLKLKDNLQSLK
ncbi:MAG: valine--tRNA ligase [Patescibacteria group bacterium]